MQRWPENSQQEKRKKTGGEAQANILHLDPNAAKNLDLDLYSQRVTKNGSVSFKTRFS